MLAEADRPVPVVRGNHDISSLASEGNFHKVDLRRLETDGAPFVGYDWLGRELDPQRQMDQFGDVTRPRPT